jgi:hypothetical protein
MVMGTSVFRIRTAVDFPPVLKSDHTMRSCRAASLRAGTSSSGSRAAWRPSGTTNHAGSRPASFDWRVRNLCRVADINRMHREAYLELAERFRRLKEGTTDDLQRSRFEEMETSYRLLAESERLLAETRTIKG